MKLDDEKEDEKYSLEEWGARRVSGFQRNTQPRF